MASEMRRMAKLLVERRSEAFASRYPREESSARLQRAIAGFAPRGLSYETAWREDGAATLLDVHFAPSPGTRLFLNTASVVMSLFMLAAVWALVSPGERAGTRMLVGLLTLGAMLAFPFIVVAFGSRRDAEEATLRRAIRKALVEEA